MEANRLTVQEAIERLKSYIGTVTAPNDSFTEAKNMAIAALEKQLPKQPEYSSDGYSPDGLEVWDAYCPACHHELDVEERCPNCGQAILWDS